jgi:hypothetical protein
MTYRPARSFIYSMTLATSVTLLVPVLGGDSIGIAEAKTRSGGGARAKSVESKGRAKTVQSHRGSGGTKGAARGKYRLGKHGSLRPNFKAQASKIQPKRRSSRDSTRRFAVIGHYSALSRNRLAFRKNANPRWQNYRGYYARVGMKSGGRHFYVPAAHYERMSKVDQWRANQRFLDRQVARGYRFRLATRIHQARPGSIYAREIAHLRNRGYEVTKNGKWMQPSNLKKPKPEPRPKGPRISP